MKGKIPVLVATLATSMSMNAAINMCVAKEDGEILKFDVEDIEEVIFEEEKAVSLEYKILSDSTVEVIKGDYAEYTSIIIPEKVEIEGNIYSVTSIESSAFSGLKNLSSITIPESVTSIGLYAFSECYGMTPGLLIYNNGTKCYGWVGKEDVCTSVVIPDGVKEIGDHAFYKFFYNLTDVTFPEGLVTIGSSAFAGAKSLKSVKIPSSVTSIKRGAFMYCNNANVEINNLQENVDVEEYALSDCKSVTWAK